MFYYMHNNNNYYYYQCKTCWNKALTFGVGSIKLSFRAIVFTQCMHAKMFSIQMLLYTFQLNCTKDFHFSVFHLLLLSLNTDPYTLVSSFCNFVNTL